MKKHPVTMFCGHEGMGHSPAQKHCNKKCSGYFVGRKPADVTVKDASPVKPKEDPKKRYFISSCDPVWREKGRRIVTKSGYVDLYFWSHELQMQFSRREHIVIWCTIHSHELPKRWCVHHRDEDRSNNAPDNLLAMPKGMHMELHRQLQVLAQDCSGLEYVVRRHALTKEFEERVRELCDWEALWRNE